MADESLFLCVRQNAARKEKIMKRFSFVVFVIFVIAAATLVVLNSRVAGAAAVAAGVALIVTLVAKAAYEIVSDQLTAAVKCLGQDLQNKAVAEAKEAERELLLRSEAWAKVRETRREAEKAAEAVAWFEGHIALKQHQLTAEYAAAAEASRIWFASAAERLERASIIAYYGNDEEFVMAEDKLRHNKLVFFGFYAEICRRDIMACEGLLSQKKEAAAAAAAAYEKELENFKKQFKVL